MESLLPRLYSEIKKSVQDCTSNNLAFSGGLDSTILAYLLKKPNTVTIIAEDFIASDLTYCQLVSKELKIKSNIETIKTEKILEGIKNVIKILKNFNDIEIRNSVVMYLAMDYFKKQGEKTLMTGDGADELFAGYNFLLNKSPQELEKEQKRIWQIMHFPSQKIGKYLGIKIESPFLSQNVKKLAESIPVQYKVKKQGSQIYGKWILRKAFEDMIPKTITWRPKSAMQDGSGTSGLSGLFDAVIQNDTFEAKKEEIAKTDRVILRTKESMHYYEIYKKHFGAIQEAKSERACPFCRYGVDSKFCRMCGAYPV